MTNTHPHPHNHFGDLNRQKSHRIGLALVLTLAFVFVEAAAGIRGNSLALLSDAGHNITDVIALGMTWYAVRLSLQPANENKTFGYHRAGILAALVNSGTLILVAGYIFYEAYQRFLSPPEVNSGILIGIGAAAFLVNAITAWLVRHGSEHDLNLHSAFVHRMGDVLSTVGAVMAGVVIALTKMNWLDPLVSVLIGGLILWNAWGILKETVEILLESTPRDVDTNDLIVSMMKVSGVKGVHDLHVWSISQNLRALSAHILTEDVSISQGARIQREISEVICEEFNIGHATLQLESVGCEPDDLFCGMGNGHPIGSPHDHPEE